MSDTLMPRFYVLSASRYDGTTPFVGPWAPDPNTQNTPRGVRTMDIVGRLSFQDLARPGATGCVVMFRRWSAAGASDLVKIRSVSAGESAQGYAALSPAPTALDQVLSLLPLTSDWSAPVILGPTDAFCPEYLPPNGGTIELMVLDILNGVPLLQLLPALCPAEVCCCIDQLEVVIPSTPDFEFFNLPPAPQGCTTFVDCSSAVSGGKLILPDLADVAEGKSYFVQRSGANWFLITGLEPINGLSAPSGVVMESLNDAVIIRANKALGVWFANKVTPDLEPVAVTLPGNIAQWSGAAVRTATPAAAQTSELPAAFNIAPSQVLWATNNGTASGSAIPWTIKPQAGERIDSVVDQELVLPNFGDTVLLLRDGSPDGFRSVDNLFGRSLPVATVAPGYVAAKGWRGRRSFVVSATGNFRLPPATDCPVGCQALVYFDALVASTVDTPDAQIYGLGNAPAASQPILGRFWGLFEFQGSAIWSFTS